jgi:hypothetical protein
MDSGFGNSIYWTLSVVTTINYNTFNLTDNTAKVSVITLHKLQTSLLTSGFFWFNCTVLLLVFLSFCLLTLDCISL